MVMLGSPQLEVKDEPPSICLAELVNIAVDLFI